VNKYLNSRESIGSTEKGNTELRERSRRRKETGRRQEEGCSEKKKKEWGTRSGRACWKSTRRKTVGYAVWGGTRRRGSCAHNRLNANQQSAGKHDASRRHRPERAKETRSGAWRGCKKGASSREDSRNEKLWDRVVTGEKPGKRGQKLKLQK